jgi:hypothetical protein
MRDLVRQIDRRNFLRRMGCGLAAASALSAVPLLAGPPPRRRRVLAMSDVHVGLPAHGLDGAQWLSRAIDDLDRNVGPFDYGLTLGDITHGGDRRSLVEYLRRRNRSRIQRWFELAGNHDHHRDGIAHYQELVRSTAPYCFVDGNIAWFFLSDENNHRPGHVSEQSSQWLRKQLESHRDKVVVVCSHQLPPDTVRRSDEHIFRLLPRDEISDILERFPIALHLCGHEHHRPYSNACVATEHGTTVINVASINRAYDTGDSASLVLEFEDGAREIVARRRSHDRQTFQQRFEVRIPLQTRIALP